MPLTEIQKFEIVTKYNNNWCITKIADSMKINRNTVSLWIKRYNQLGNLNRKRGSGMTKKKNIHLEKHQKENIIEQKEATE
jgi:transposase